MEFEVSNEQIRQVIGRRVKHYRKMKSLTQRELAAEIGVNHSYIANIEQGQKGISLEKMLELCMWFNISLSDLLPINEQSNNEKENMIKKIADSLRSWETEQVKLLEAMVLGTQCIHFQKNN